MGNPKNRGQQKGKPTPPPVPSTPTPSAVPPPAQPKPSWDRSDVISGVALAVSVVSAVLAGLAWNESATANKLTKIAQDRAAGKVQAQFELLEDNLGKPQSPKEFMRKREGFDEITFRIESGDELIQWSPYIRLKNTGTEPIEAIKIDVTHLLYAAYGKDVKQIYPEPKFFNDSTNYEATNFGKLMPGQTATIAISSLLVSLMSRNDWKDYADKDRCSIFRIEASCRLVGSQSYDQLPATKARRLEFDWKPGGFEPNAKYVNGLLEKKPHVKIS